MGGDPKAYIFVGVLTVIGTIITTLLVQKVTRRGQNLANGVAVVDNYQEDLAALRKENADLKAQYQADTKELRDRMDKMERSHRMMRNEANRVVDEARTLYYSVDEEVIELRKGINENNVPPLPPRPIRSPFPALDFFGPPPTPTPS